MYSLFGYGKMIADRQRMNAYVNALKRAVKPGSIVLDLGTGTGIFAILACQLGAKRVYAIEPSSAISTAKLAAKDNGVADRIEFIQALSVDIDLPEKVDVIVADLRGILPFFQQHIPAIIDARSRFLKARGILIPESDRVWATCVHAPELYQTYSSPWQDFPYRINLASTRKFLLHSWQKCEISVEQCWAKSQLLTILNYNKISTPNLQAKLEWQAEKNRLLHGLCLWFDSTLVAGIEFSNAPGKPKLIYGQGFFPWLEPVTVEPGDRITCNLKANLLNQKYIWQWNTKIISIAGEIKANFKQSTFNGQPIEPEALKRRTVDYIPQVNEEGKLVRFILSAIDGNNNLEEIARQCVTIFPDRFTHWQQSLSQVREVVDRYKL